MCPLFRGSTVHKEEDSLSIVDKMAGPNVSLIQRFICIECGVKYIKISEVVPEIYSFLRNKSPKSEQAHVENLGVHATQWKSNVQLPESRGATASFEPLFPTPLFPDP